jgi:predicted membrane-bound spermidine synthase
MKKNGTRLILYLVFALSGFTGLVYESIWSHYLKLFLGHAAYAQALVLAIFMGGMAIGAWLAAKYAGRIRNLLLAYALAELLVGLAGLMFHPVFQWLITVSSQHIYPAIESAMLVQAYKWSTVSLIILPQSILLGTTFPLMSNGLIRLHPGTPGRSLATLYFTNSIGAAVGVLVSGFYLIATVGLPGTIMAAGIINILLAIIVYGLAKKHSAPVPVPVKRSDSRSWPVLLLCAAFITGAASFIYEIAWIRMLSMVLGASTHAFELMLSAFITGLAFGGLWIRKRIDRFADPVRAIGRIQIIMGLLALLTIPMYNQCFDMMEFFLQALDKSQAGYTLYNFISHILTLVVMLPATFCAGMTLPLLSFILLGKGYGERSIGQIYSCNTLGAIAGVIFTVFAGMPYLGLKGSMLTGSILDIGLGLLLLGTGLQQARHWSGLKFTVVTCALFLLAISLFAGMDRERMSSGVFRRGSASLPDDTTVIYYRDGMTASVSVTEWQSTARAIKTNGKSDAAININDRNNPTNDESTMTLLGALPLSIHPAARSVANIGMGSGMTTHILLGWPGIESVDTIEIEPAMVEGAAYFRKVVERTFTDPKSHIYIEDARTFFPIHKKKYDIIVSEPSNPWVSGTSSLFTEEFYRIIKQYLNPEGMLVQWLHTYETEPELVFSIIKALSVHFSFYHIYIATDGDLVLLAKSGSPIGFPQTDLFESAVLARELNTVGLGSVRDFNVRFLGGDTLFSAYINETGIRANSDYFPVLDIKSARAMYMDLDAYEIYDPRLFYLPVIAVLYPWADAAGSLNISYSDYPQYINKYRYAGYIYKYIKRDDRDLPLLADAVYLEVLRQPEQVCSAGVNEHAWIDSLLRLMMQTLPYLGSAEILKLASLIEPPCSERLSARQQYWLTLFKSIGARDMDTTAGYAGELISGEFSHTLLQMQYLFSSLMMSLVAEDRNGEAIAIWNTYASELYGNSAATPFTLELLLAMAVAGSRGTAASE